MSGKFAQYESVPDVLLEYATGANGDGANGMGGKHGHGSTDEVEKVQEEQKEKQKQTSSSSEEENNLTFWALIGLGLILLVSLGGGQ